jgi:NADH-quinone oxidoreductase subunit D
MFQERERIYDMFEEVCGSRLTTNIGRIGGMERDFTPTFHARLKDFLKGFPARFEEFNNLLARNRIFMDRCIGAGPISAERASPTDSPDQTSALAGVDYDVRVMSPYSSYEDFDFDIPVGSAGDTYDRFVVRQEEIRQSLRIIHQAYDKLPEGRLPRRCTSILPARQTGCVHKMEALIYHFKVVMQETPIPVGEVYHSVEGANGELGFTSSAMVADSLTACTSAAHVSFITRHILK